MAVAQSIDQQVIDNNKEIFARIEKELQEAEFEILIASAWFTDNELFAVLLQKLAEGVKVELIIADNQENEKLDFSLLKSKGALVFKIKNVGYGMMHQKFSVIDKRLALHGSYNWSNNAKKNNHESIIATNHKETVESLITNFNNIKQKAMELSGQTLTYGNQIKEKAEETGIHIDNPATLKSDYERILDSMIAAEVSSFDRDSLRKQGYDRSYSNNGDHQVLHKSLDTLYSGFINDIDVIEDKKRRLLSKVDEQKTKTVNLLREKHNFHLTTTEIEFETNIENLKNRITICNSDIAVNKNIIQDLKINKIGSFRDKIDLLKEEIKEGLSNFVKPAFKWFDFIPVSIITTALFSYLLLFYSSAAYILLFSKQDAEVAAKLPAGAQGIAPPEVFDPNAIMKAFEHGGSAPFFVFLFVFIPLTFALMSRLVSNKVLGFILSIVFGVLIIDITIAYKVAESIHRVSKLRGDTLGEWQPFMVFQDTNFYLVFIMGAFGLILFKFAFDKFIGIFEDRNPDIAAQRNSLHMQHKREDIENCENKVSECKEEIELKEKENIEYQAEITIKEAELASLPIKKAHQLNNKNSELAIKIQTIESTTDIYRSHIENDNVPVSVDALRDRINVFLEGWNDFLHKEYSIIKATEKSKAASDVAISWEALKITTNSIDPRVKVK